MKTLSKYPPKIKIGKTHDNEVIFLSAPKWDSWYWAFGYLGNERCHYHVNGLMEISHYCETLKCSLVQQVDLNEGFKLHFKELNIRISQLAQLTELFLSFYALKKTAEVLNRGGAHYTSNPCKDIIMNREEVDRINQEVMPHIFEAIYAILLANQNNESLFKALAELNTCGDTHATIAFMKEHDIKFADLERVEGFTQHDISVIVKAWRNNR